MSITTYSDISFVLSGGATNINPNASLGGESSSSPITDLSVNNLFNDVSPIDSEEGIEDYRCFYVYNDGPTPVYNIKLWIASEYDGGSSVELGIDTKDEIQRVTIGSSAVASGSMTFSYQNSVFVVNHDSDINIWANNFRRAINELTALGGVTVVGKITGSVTIFDVTFSGRSGRRSHPDLVVFNNGLNPTTTINVSTTQIGSPINTIASEIGVSTNPPGGVSFGYPTKDVPLTLPRLNPEDNIPIWIKRTVLAGTTAVEQDGFTFRFSAASLET